MSCSFLPSFFPLRRCRLHRSAICRWCNNGEVGGVESQQKDKQRNCLKKMRYNSTTNPKWRIDPVGRRQILFVLIIRINFSFFVPMVRIWLKIEEEEDIARNQTRSSTRERRESSESGAERRKYLFHFVYIFFHHLKKIAEREREREREREKEFFFRR